MLNREVSEINELNTEDNSVISLDINVNNSNKDWSRMNDKSTSTSDTNIKDRFDASVMKTNNDEGDMNVNKSNNTSNISMGNITAENNDVLIDDRSDSTSDTSIWNATAEDSDILNDDRNDSSSDISIISTTTEDSDVLNDDRNDSTSDTSIRDIDEDSMLNDNISYSSSDISIKDSTDEDSDMQKDEISIGSSDTSIRTDEDSDEASDSSINNTAESSEESISEKSGISISSDDSERSSDEKSDNCEEFEGDNYESDDSVYSGCSNSYLTSKYSYSKQYNKIRDEKNGQTFSKRKNLRITIKYDRKRSRNIESESDEENGITKTSFNENDYDKETNTKKFRRKLMKKMRKFNKKSSEDLCDGSFNVNENKDRSSVNDCVAGEKKNKINEKDIDECCSNKDKEEIDSDGSEICENLKK